MHPYVCPSNRPEPKTPMPDPVMAPKRVYGNRPGPMETPV